MFQFRAFPSYAYFVQRTIPKYCSGGFPHSDISGSLLICSSPKLFAAYHVLHRLLMPRHSPCALYSLTKEIFWFSWIMQAINRLLRKIVIVYPHLFRCSTIKTKNTFFCSFKQKTSLLPCLSLLHYIVQFSRFDLPTAFAARFEDLSYARSSNPTTNVTGMVGPSGLEPPTLRLSVVRSSQLSYGPLWTWWR